MTVNKAQGQSIQSVKVNLQSSAFTHEQLYVALFKAVNVFNVTVLLLKVKDSKTDNVVYLKVLLNQ